MEVPHILLQSTIIAKRVPPQLEEETPLGHSSVDYSQELNVMLLKLNATSKWDKNQLVNPVRGLRRIPRARRRLSQLLAGQTKRRQNSGKIKRRL